MFKIIQKRLATRALANTKKHTETDTTTEHELDLKERNLK